MTAPVTLGFVVIGLRRRVEGKLPQRRRLSRRYHTRSAAEALLQLLRRDPWFHVEYEQAWVADDIGFERK